MSTSSLLLREAYPLSSIQGVEKTSTELWGQRFVVAILIIWASAFVIGFMPALGILAALGFASAVVGLRCPFIGLIGVGILCTISSPMRIYLMTGGFLRWNTFNYWLLVVMVLAAPMLLRRTDPHTRLLQAIIVFLLVGLTITPSMLSGIQSILRFVVAFGLLVYFGRVEYDESAWYYLGLAIGALAGAGGLVFWLQRGSLPYIDTNGLATFWGTALFGICLAYKSSVCDGQRQFILESLALINSFWVVLTGSRGGMLIAACCLSYLFFEIRGLGRRLLLITFAALLTIVVSMQFTDLTERASHRVNKLLDSDLSLTSRTSGRYDLLLGALSIFRDNPLGVGTGGFTHCFSRLEDRENLATHMHGRNIAAHSLWAKTLAENGIFGFTLLCGYAFSFALVGWTKRKKGLLTIGMLATAILGVSFITNDNFGRGVAMLAAGVTVLLHRSRSGNSPQS